MKTRRLGMLALSLAGACLACGCPGNGTPPPPDAGSPPDAGPTTGFLSISLAVPNGLSGDVTVTGPNGFARALNQSTVIIVPPGSYSVVAGNVLGNTPSSTPAEYRPTVTGSPASVVPNNVAQIVVGYNFVEGSGKIWLTGVDSTSGTANAALFGFVPFAAEPELLVDYAPTSLCLEAMALDTEGSIWVVDDCGAQILKFTANQLESGPLVLVQPAVSIVNNPDGGGYQLLTPESPAFDSEGNLWVSDHSRVAILKYGNVAAMSGTVLNEPLVQLYNNPDAGPVSLDGGFNFVDAEGIAFDSAGSLWVASFFTNQVIKYSNPGALSGVVGPSPDVVLTNVQDGGSAAFDNPNGLAFDSQNNLWVANFSEFGQGSVSKLALSQLTASADVRPAALLENSTPNSPFLGPECLAFDQAGNLWVGDDNQAEELAADVSSALGVVALDAGWSFVYLNNRGGVLVDPTPAQLPLYH